MMKTKQMKVVDNKLYMSKWSLEELGKKYEYYFYGVHIDYYILEYKDGSYRFAVRVANT